MTKQFARIIAIITLFILFGCGDKKENNAVFVKETPVKEDATKTWLHDVENYKKDKNYLSVLYKYYNQKIEEKNYLHAAEVLDAACMYLADSFDYNETFMATIKEFDAKYRKEVPALKSTFIDAYFSHYYNDKYDLKKACEYLKNITLLEPNDYNSCYNTARAYYDLSYIYYIMGKQNLSLVANQKSLDRKSVV